MSFLDYSKNLRDSTETPHPSAEELDLQRVRSDYLLESHPCLNLSLTPMLLLTLFLFFSKAWANTYYVDVITGNDNNQGILRNAPLKTIQRVSDKTVPGDKILVLAGFYNERAQITRSGASGQPIVYQAEGSVITHGFTIIADYIHIIGFEIMDTINDWKDGAGIHLQGKYGEVKSNYIHDVTGVGIQVWSADKDSPNTNNCHIIGNRIVRAGLSGIEIYGKNHLIEGNDISHTLQYPPKRTTIYGWEDADGMRFFGSGHTIRKNRIHDITMSDIGNFDPHIDCFQTWGPAYNIVFEQNFCENLNDGMQGFMIQEINKPVRDLLVKNNVIKAFRLLNVFNCENMVVVNNSFKSELRYRGASGYGIELHGSPNSKVMNNLFYDVGRHSYPYLYKDSASQSGLDVGYNCVYMSDGNPPAGAPWPNDLWQIDPKLVNISGNDFHLRPGSPLINAGANLTQVTTDFDGILRPQGSRYDIGAFEFFTHGK